MVKGVFFFVLFVAGLVIPPLYWSGYYIYILALLGIYIIISTGLNLFQGYAGQLSLGHAGFVGIGAYSAALLSVKWGIPYGWAILLGGLFASVGGLGLGLPVLRLREIYLVMATVAFGEVVQLSLVHLPSITQGDVGITVPNLSLPIVGSLQAKGIYCVIYILCILGLVVARNIVKSRTGRAFMSLRDSPEAARCLGIHVSWYKTISFMLSAFYAGIGGGLMGALTLYLHPSNFTIMQSIDYLLIIVLGGLGTISGPIFGSALLIILQEGLRNLSGVQEVVAGLLLFLCILFLPFGIKPFIFEKVSIGWEHLTRYLRR